MISVSPEPGKQATKGRTVTLTVSKGQEGVVVPGVVGNTADGATQMLEDAGLKVAGDREGELASPRARCSRRTRRKGATLPPRAATVQIIVAKAAPDRCPT